MRWSVREALNIPIAIGPRHSFRDPVASELLFETSPQYPTSGHLTATWLGRCPEPFMIGGGTILSRRPDSWGYHPPPGISARDALVFLEWHRSVGPKRASSAMKKTWRVLHGKRELDLAEFMEPLRPEIEGLERFLRALPHLDDLVLAEYCVRPNLTKGV